MIKSNKLLQTISTVSIIIISIAIAIYSFYIMYLGTGEPVHSSSAILQGGIILSGSIFVIIGVIKPPLYRAWLGFGILAVSATLFLFGAGTQLLPAVGLLFILLLMVTFVRRTGQS